MMRVTKSLIDFERDKRDLTVDALLAEIEAEERNDGFESGDLVGHADFTDFRARFVEYDNGKAKVIVIAGWRGRYVPTDPVSIPREKLEALA